MKPLTRRRLTRKIVKRWHQQPRVYKHFTFQRLLRLVAGKASG